jgi:hypothetical protein
MMDWRVRNLAGSQWKMGTYDSSGLEDLEDFAINTLE